MNLKLSIAALVLALAVPATAQTILTMPEGCEGAAIGDVLADGTLCVVLNTGALGNSITPFGGSDADGIDQNEAAEHETSALHTRHDSTDDDSSEDANDDGSDHDSDTQSGDD